MPRLLHPIAGSLAAILILAFWSSTLLAELGGDAAVVLAVKTWILWGMALLVPALALTGASGVRLTGGAPRSALIARKLRRMPILAANGLLVLVPCAFYLQARAAAGQFDPLFYGVQVIELIAGAVNLTLLVLNLRDGLSVSGRFARVV